jgi:MFS family permease
LTTAGILGKIEEHFDINHQQGGLLQTAFIICYFASAPIFGFLGDRYSRKYLMLFGIFTWGSCTFISSFMPVISLVG